MLSSDTKSFQNSWPYLEAHADLLISDTSESACKKPHYKKLRHSIHEKAMDKTIGYCSKTIG